MSLSYVTFDVFSSTTYAGNPLAIVHVPASQSLSHKQKQQIAREFNLGESVFLHEQSESDMQNGDIRTDIFTPYAEVPFAGHPTVGLSNYLLRHLKGNGLFQNVLALQVKAGRIPIELTEDGTGAQLQLAHNVHVHDTPFADRPFSHYPVVSIVKGMTFILAQLPSLEELAVPTESLLRRENTYKSYQALDEGWQIGLVGTYFFTDLGVDEQGVRQLRTRMFASIEDYATGSAASALCSYLTLSEEGHPVRKYQVTQGVEIGRKSDIHIRVTLNTDKKTVHEVLLSGTAVQVMEGKVRIPSDS